MNQIVLRPPSMPLPTDLAQEFSLSTADWRVLVDQLYPSAKSSESVAMALSYCRARNLDIFKRPVHIVPMWSSALNKMVETVWPGIAEIRTTAARTGEYAGIDAVEFGPIEERTFYGEKDKWENRKKVGTEKFSKVVRYPEWASVVVYRWVKGEKAAFHAKIYWEETYASVGKTEVPNDMWGKRPRGQIDKCVEAAALRKAFPEELGNTYAAEEMEGRTIDFTVVDHETTRETPAAPRPPKPPVQSSIGSTTQSYSASRTIDEEPEGDIEDAEVIEGEEEQTEETIGEYFERLDTEMAKATNAIGIAEVWNEFDPLAKFEGDEESQALATSIKRRHVQRVGGGREQG